MDDKYLSYIKTEREKEIFDQLKELRAINFENEAAIIDKYYPEVFLSSEYLNKRKIVVEAMKDILEAENYELLIELVVEYTELILMFLTEDEILNLEKKLIKIDKDRRAITEMAVLYTLNSDFIIDLAQKVSESPFIASQLRLYEEAIKFLDKAEFYEFEANLAGNIATVYRRRFDKENTFKYHKLSSEIYRRLNKTRDFLIEDMNLATAYETFGELDKAIETLQELYYEAQDLRQEEIQAFTAGNLAHMLLFKDDIDKYKSLIEECFETDEEYCRKSGNYKDLAVALFNQTHYLTIQEVIDVDKLNSLYQELVGLVTDYDLEEFYDSLDELEELVRELNYQ